jgi:hypothetical protein
MHQVHRALVRSQVHGVAFPEQQRLKIWPYLFVAPMFAEDVGWVVSTMDVVDVGSPYSISDWHGVL